MFEGLVLITPEEINSQISQYCNDFDRELIKKAYIFALTRHGTQLRESGDPYFSHPLEVTKILIELKMDQETIIAGMLHDILEDTATTMKELSEQFGQKIASIVNGVTKLTKFEGISIAENQIANFRKLLISAASDIRIPIIKLADRLHNMRTLAYKKKRAKRQSIAKETLEIYAPLAERIGLANIKEELQDIAFHELHPDIYNTLKSKLNEHIASTEHEINIISEKLLELSQSIDPNCAVSGRIKSPYSIWKKLTVRNISFEQLSDIIAFRVIVDTIPQCYQVLGAIHRSYLVIPGKFKDYISTPKNNNYQSLHTNIIGPLNKRIEVQIRTKEMHLVAEYGVAAHWNYKTEESESQSKIKADTLWINDIVQVLENTSGMEEFLKETQTGMLTDKVFCLTPKGTIISLPKGASVLDFAYEIHSDVGNHAVGAKINGVPVPLNTIIKNGDQVDVRTDPSSSPEKSWEKLVVTTKAKTAIKKELKSFEKERAEMIGKSNLYEFFQNHNVALLQSDIKQLAGYFKFREISRLFYAIGVAEITLRQVVEAYNKQKNTNITVASVHSSIPSQEKNDKQFPILGLPHNSTILSNRCCTPVAGDKIIGIITSDNNIEIHITECRMCEYKFKEGNAKIIPLAWNDDAFTPEYKYSARLYVSVYQASGNLSRIAKTIEKLNASIVSLSFGEKYDNLVSIKVEIEVMDIAHLTMIIATLRSLKIVSKVDRG